MASLAAPVYEASAHELGDQFTEFPRHVTMVSFRYHTAPAHSQAPRPTADVGVVLYAALVTTRRRPSAESACSIWSSFD